MNTKTTSNTLAGLLIMLMIGVVGTGLFLSNASAESEECVAPPSGIISWWPGDGTAVDIGDGNDGTLSGGAYATGYADEAFSLDGQDDYVLVAEGGGTSLDGLSAMSIEAWIRPDNYGWPNPEPDSEHDAAIISKYDSTEAGGVSFQLSLRDGRPYFVVGGSGDPQPLARIVADNAVTLNEWSHVALVWQGQGQLALFVDGSQVPASVSTDGGDVSLSSDNAIPVNIGRVESYSGTHTGPAAYFDGLLDEVTIYARALTAGEIAAIAGAPEKCKTGNATDTPEPTNTPTATPTPPDHYLPVVVKSLPTPTPLPTATATPTPQPGPVIVNGGFEAGHVGWSEYSAHGYYIIVSEDQLPVDAHDGSWAAWLGGEYDEASIIEQVVTIPADRHILNYWLWIASEDVCGADYDIGGVLVDEEAVDAYYLCDPNNTYGWIPRSVNLADYAGQTVTLTFAAFTDFVLNSNLFIDDVSVQVSPLAPTEAPEMVTDSATERKASYSVGNAQGQTVPDFLAYRKDLLELLQSEQ